MKITLIVFPKKIILWDNWAIFGRTMMCCRNCGSALIIFLKILQNERGEEMHQSYISALKKLSCGNWATSGLKMMCPQNSGSALMIFLKTLLNETNQEVHQN